MIGLTAFQRIHLYKHLFSDIVLGDSLGTIIELKVVKLNARIWLSEFEADRNEYFGRNKQK